MEGNLNWKESLASNLARLRRDKGLTQAELGEKLNYSDKSISKWERGEGVPDIQVLIRLSDLYGVSLDELTGRSTAANSKKEEKLGRLRDRTFMMVITQCVIWLIAIILFCVFMLFDGLPNKWLAFIYAIPVSFLCPGIYFVLWKMYYWAFGAFSLMMWMFCVAIQLTLGAASAQVVYLVGLALQLAAVMIVGIIVWRSKRTTVK